MDLAKSWLEAFGSLCGIQEFQLDNVDESNLSSYAREYIMTINDCIPSHDGQHLLLAETIQKIISTMRVVLEKHIEVQASRLSEVIKCNQDTGESSQRLKDMNLLQTHIEFMSDLHAKGILPGQQFYTNTGYNFDPDSEELHRFLWDFPPFDIPWGVFENLRRPEKIFLQPPGSIDNYHRFHDYLYYELATRIYRRRQYDLKGVILTVHNDEYLLLNGYNLIFEPGNRLIFKSDLHKFYLGAYVHSVCEGGYLIKMHKKIHREGVDGLKFDLYTVSNLCRILCHRRQHAVRYMVSNRTSARLLFPEIKSNFDLMLPKIPVKLSQIDTIKWFDDRLNSEQRLAVIQMMRSVARPAPFLLIGAPGTGRTTTIIEALLQIYTRNKETRILVCGHRDNELATRILQSQVVRKDEILWLVAAYRLKQEMSRDLADISLISDAISPDMFRLVRVVVSSCYQADRLRIFEDKFDFLFICDANVYDEPQTLICLRHLKPDGCAILTGDPSSGEPLCISEIMKANGFGVSLMERLAKCEPYRLRRYPDGSMALDDRYKIVLTKNYRHDYRLMKPSDELFYGHSMICDAKSPGWLLDSMGSPTNPLIFHHVEGMNLKSSKEQTWNPNELIVCLNYLKRLLAIGVKPEQIGVITPYPDQEFRLEMMIDTNLGLQDFFIDGLRLIPPEKEIMIISTVRSEPDEQPNNLSARNLNNILTRAKWMVIMIGHRNYLKNHPLGSRYLKYAQEMKF